MEEVIQMKTAIKTGMALVLFAMLSIFLPMAALAAEPAAKIGATEYSTLSKAIDNVADGQTIVLQKNIADEAIVISRSGQTFTINLNGYTVSESKDNCSAIKVIAGNVTIKNGTVLNTGSIVSDYAGGVSAWSGAKVVLSGLNVTGTNDCAVFAWGTTVDILSGAYTGFDDAIYTGCNGDISATVNIYSGVFTVHTGSDAGFDDGALFAEPGCTIATRTGAFVDPSDWQTAPSLTITAIYFGDVSTAAWYRSYVYDLAQLGIINGRAENSYEPEGKVTRAEFAKILAVASGDDLSSYTGTGSFSDVATTAWYNKFVNWAADKGIVNGRGKGLYVPNDPITRQEMAVMLYRYLTEVAEEDGLTLPLTGSSRDFSDNSRISAWATAAVDAMVKASVIGGYSDNTFRPGNAATRAETAKMVSVFLASLEAVN